MTTAIEFDRVSKTFRSRKGAVTALSDVSFSVMEGETFGFIGPNGAGKSTTIKILLDVVRGYVGRATLFGHDVRSPEARQQVAYVPETPALYDTLTPLEILRCGLRFHGIRRDREDAWCKHWLERFSVSHVADRRLRDLSKGTVQRVALAHAMVVTPRLLILDEPLSGLDPIGRRDVVEILAEYQHQGGTIFVTSHVLHDVERLAARFGVIHRGRLRAIRAPAELLAQEHSFTVRTLGQRPVDGFREEMPGRWVGEAERTELWARIGALRDAGHEIFEVRPALTLESAVMKYLSEPDQTDVQK